MGGIPEHQVEWAVVNRLKSMLETPTQTPFNVTLTFALFSTIVVWTKNRIWVGGRDPDQRAFDQADHAAFGARQRLADVKIMDAPWSLSRRPPLSAMQADGDHSINRDFEEISAEDFVVWLRNALAHGDGRSIRPLHKPSRDHSREWLAGMIIDFEERKGSERRLTVALYDSDMRRIGVQLADLFCQSLAGDRDYDQLDEATRIVEEVAA